MEFTRFNVVGLLIVNFLPIYFCEICHLCVCTQPENSRIINCQGKRDIDNYTDIFDLLAFDESAVVKKLIISKNDITSLPLDAFRGLKNLKSLDLSENSMDHFDSDVLKNLKDLEELDISFNQLSTLNGAVFNNVKSLLILNLSNNRINDLNEITADQLPKLTSLDLSYNNLQSIDSDFIKSLTKLNILDISFNRVSSLPSNTLLKLKYLVELRASNNLLKIISDQNFPASLKTLNVAGNAISSLPLRLPEILYLNIANNTISSIEIEAPPWLKKLKYFNISDNSLTSFPPFVFDELKTLDLSRNNFTIVPKTLSYVNLPTLEALVIDGNPIKYLTFIEELHLQNLYVRHLDRLESIEPNTFVKIKGIHDECINLTISNNPRLNDIKVGALDGVSICFLDLSKNGFTRIPSGVIKTKDKFMAEKGIDLQGNLFNCDCQSQWMLNDLVPYLYKVNPKLLDDLRCDKPSELSGARMVHWFMWKKQVFCDDFRMSLATASGERTIRLKSSGEALAIVAGATGTLCVLIIVGTIFARKLELRKRRANRKF